MSKKSPLSDEDKKLFQEAMRSVKPLGAQKPHAHSKHLKSKPAPSIPHQHSPLKPAESSHYPLSDYVANPISSEATLTFAKPGLLASQFKRLKQGLIPIEATLDLHGVHAAEASQKLCEFIDSQHTSGKRCLLIIHGKGGKHGDAPVLKNLVHTWLKQLPKILAFHSAKPHHGGTGALYVLLNR